MGESSRKSRKFAHILAREPRCIYCLSKPSSIEHMPPIALFKARSRPNGMEFGACEECNRGTSSADLVASFFARLSRAGDSTLVNEAVARRNRMNLVAPGVLKELFRPEKQTDVVTRLPSGILKPEVHVNADGILTRGYLSVFAAKFGMAIYREHVGMALPMEGGVHAAHYLNAGLADDAAKAMLKMLPLSRTLQQGKFIVPDQFAYRYNSDEKSIAAALASFHSNLFVFVIATSKPALFGLPFIDPHAAFFVPGELVRRMPN